MEIIFDYPSDPKVLGRWVMEVNRKSFERLRTTGILYVAVGVLAAVVAIEDHSFRGGYCAAAAIYLLVGGPLIVLRPRRLTARRVAKIQTSVVARHGRVVLADSDVSFESDLVRMSFPWDPIRRVELHPTHLRALAENGDLVFGYPHQLSPEQLNELYGFLVGRGLIIAPAVGAAR